MDWGSKFEVDKAWTKGWRRSVRVTNKTMAVHGACHDRLNAARLKQYHGLFFIVHRLYSAETEIEDGKIPVTKAQDKLFAKTRERLTRATAPLPRVHLSLAFPVPPLLARHSVRGHVESHRQYSPPTLPRLPASPAGPLFECHRVAGSSIGLTCTH